MSCPFCILCFPVIQPALKFLVLTCILSFLLPCLCVRFPLFQCQVEHETVIFRLRFRALGCKFPCPLQVGKLRITQDSVRLFLCSPPFFLNTCHPLVLIAHGGVNISRVCALSCEIQVRRIPYYVPKVSEHLPKPLTPFPPLLFNWSLITCQHHRKVGVNAVRVLFQLSLPIFLVRCVHTLLQLVKLSFIHTLHRIVTVSLRRCRWLWLHRRLLYGVLRLRLVPPFLNFL